MNLVVPHAGTWIEIQSSAYVIAMKQSFPTRERGLKSPERVTERK